MEIALVIAVVAVIAVAEYARLVKLDRVDAALLLVLAVAAGLQWFLLPGVRWYFRRKVRRVLDEIQLRLKIELPQFKLTRRRALIDRLMSDPRVMAAAQQHGIETGKSAEALKLVEQLTPSQQEKVGALGRLRARAVGGRVADRDAQAQALQALGGGAGGYCAGAVDGVGYGAVSRPYFACAGAFYVA